MNKKLSNIIWGVFAWCLIALPFNLIGQTDSEQQDFEEDLTVNINWQLQLKNSYKIKEAPQIVDSTASKQKIEYLILPYKLDVTAPVARIRPASLRLVNPLNRLYKGYLKAGIGNYTTPVASLYLNSLRSKKWAYGLALNHHSSHGKMKGYPRAQFLHDDVTLWGKYYLKDQYINPTLQYDLDQFNFYATSPEDSLFQDDDFKQTSHRIQAGILVSKFQKDTTKLNHQVGVNYKHYTDRWQASEHHAILKTKLNKYFNQEFFYLDGSADFLTYTSQQNRMRFDDSLVAGPRDNSSLIMLSPHIKSSGKNWEVKAGLSVFIDIENQAKFTFYPDAEFRYSLFNHILVPYAGITGQKIRNTYNDISKSNPWVLSQISLQNTNEKLNLYGGIRGVLSANTSFNLSASYMRADDRLLFVNDSTPGNGRRFDVLYDNTTSMHFVGEFSYQQSEKLKLHLTGKYNLWQPEVEEYAWHLPSHELVLSAWYDLRNKLVFKGSIYYTSSRWARSFDRQGDQVVVTTLVPEKIKGFVDANLALEYRYTKRLSAFLEFNNFLGSQYNRWSQYPVQRFQVLGGITYAFWK